MGFIFNDLNEWKMELTTELKTALWQIANLAMDCHDNKLNGEEFEQAAFNTLKQVKNIAYEPVLASVIDNRLDQLDRDIENSKPFSQSFMNLKEMNEKIRVFMGEPESSSKFGQIPYHLKWDCLMTVVERINKRDWVTIYDDECKIHALVVGEFETIDIVKEGESLILAVHEAVYKYVEWYLQNVA